MDSTTIFTTITSTQGGKEITANALFHALSPSGAFGRNDMTSLNLTWQSYGVPRWYINTTATAKANFSQALTASGTRFFQINRSLTPSEVGTVFSPDHLALYKVVTSASAASSWEDHRDPHHINRFLYGYTTVAMGGSNKTLTYEQAMCESVECTGSSASILDLIVPAVPRAWSVYANTSGGGGIRVKTASGTGITIADGMTAIVVCNGTNVLRVTADTAQ